MIAEALANYLQYGERVALQACGVNDDREGMFLCAEGGGPVEPMQAFDLTSRTEAAGPWESFTVRRGN